MTKEWKLGKRGCLSKIKQRRCRPLSQAGNTVADVGGVVSADIRRVQGVPGVVHPFPCYLVDDITGNRSRPG